MQLQKTFLDKSIFVERDRKSSYGKASEVNILTTKMLSLLAASKVVQDEQTDFLVIYSDLVLEKKCMAVYACALCQMIYATLHVLYIH